MEWHIIWILALVVIYNLWRYYHQEDDNTEIYQANNQVDSNENSKNNMEEVISTRQLALKTIENIGSVPQYTEEGRIRFEYQGVIFLMEATNGCLFVNLIWPWCHSFSKFDIDELSRVRQVINEVNIRSTPSVIYTFSDSDEVAVHIKKNFLLIPQIPDLEDYLKVTLEYFFRTARTLDLEIEKYRMQECEKQI